MDALTENEAAPEKWADFSRSEIGRTTSLILAIRPSDNVRRQFFSARPGSVLLQPPSLADDASLTLFCAAYEGHQNRFAQQIPAIKRIATGIDGNLVPLLVKIALVVSEDLPGDSVISTGWAMRSFLNRIFEASDPTRDVQIALRHAAGELAKNAYWNFGSRTVHRDSFSLSGADFDKMVRIGILIRKFPDDVFVFWHDTIQTYLAAEALVDLWNGRDTNFLVRACNLEIFFPDRRVSLNTSEFMTEMFQFCLWTAPHPRGAFELMKRTVLHWVNDRPYLFSTNDVIQGLNNFLKLDIDKFYKELPVRAISMGLDLAELADQNRAIPLATGSLFAALSRRVFAA
ncbi:MAG TPA: hypothetical protein PLB73_17900, partial [Leptospiraceae bacterium]|nr:hypothetical protein [Leptospiraceae bacterium]